MDGRAAAIAVAMLLMCGTARETSAGKPGGASPPPATGTIYYTDDATHDAAANTVAFGSMDGSGGSRAVLGTMSSLGPVMSRRLHGGRRWVLVWETVAGEPGFGGNTKRRDVFAVREDGALHVRLTGEATMEYWNAQWAPDEDSSGATVSMLGRQWTGSTSEDTVVDGTWGLYTAHLAFDGDGNVAGLDADPAFSLLLGTYGPAGREGPDVTSYSWAPDMTGLVADDRLMQAIRVIDASNGAVVPLGPGRDPDWSPDGSKIAYRRSIDGRKPGDALQTVRPDGSGVATVLFLRSFSSGAWQHMDRPKWSPDGAYLAYQYTFENGSSSTRSIYRIAADGTGNTNLTPEVTTGSGGGFFGLFLRNWR
jgi:hypothetical protein